jgi:hypothetical protein
MAEIRPFRRADLPAVAALLAANLPPWTEEERIPRSLAGTYLESPWTDEELPSLVASDHGEVIGFVGCQVRRFRFDDRRLRGVCPSHLTVDPDRRGGAAGALLLRRLLTAGQDFSFSDTANEEVIRMWRAFGGQLDSARGCDWMVVLAPLRWLRRIAAAKLRRRAPGPDQVPVSALPFQAARRGKRALPERDPGVSGEDVDAATIVAHLPAMTAGFRLRVDYDQRFLSHLFGEMESQFGHLVRRLVRRGERPLGWYAYVTRPGGTSRLLHLMAGERDADAVLNELLNHAREQGSAVVTGRLEPHLSGPLQHLQPVLGFARQPVIHSHDPEVRAILATSSSLLTQLDSEWFAT